MWRQIYSGVLFCWSASEHWVCLLSSRGTNIEPWSVQEPPRELHNRYQCKYKIYLIIPCKFLHGSMVCSSKVPKMDFSFSKPPTPSGDCFSFWSKEWKQFSKSVNSNRHTASDGFSSVRYLPQEAKTALAEYSKYLYVLCIAGSKLLRGAPCRRETL